MTDPKANFDTLAIYLHGRRVGVIARLYGDRHQFSFEPDYIDDPHRATLSLSFKGRDGRLLSYMRPVTRRVPPFFSNLLPEGHLRTYLAERAGVHAEREFYLLAALGADLPGAIKVEPFSASPASNDKSAEPLTSGAQVHSPEQQPLRFSLAGVQLKFSAVMESSGGLTIPAEGIGGSWIVKLPSTRFAAVPENEFLMLKLARAAGIQTPPTRLTPISSVAGLPEEASQIPGMALAVQRFDRTPQGDRIHMEDFAQVFSVYPESKYKDASYSNVAAVIIAEAGLESALEFVRRVVFSVLIGNADMHLKNWSLLYPDTRRPVLSPAYDFVATLPYLPDDKLALTFGGSRSLHEITQEQVRRFADKARLPLRSTWDVVIDTVERVRDAWATLGHKDLLPPDMLQTIDTHMQSVIKRML